MKTTITINTSTRKRLNKAKYEMDCKNLDEVINKVFNIVEKIEVAK